MRLVGSGLRCVRGGREVFAGLGFELGSAEVLAVTGPNGTGKSSLLRLVAGLLRPVEGTIALAGGGPELTLAEQAHYLGHLDPLKPALTVAENLDFWLRFLGADGSAAEALATMGLLDLAGLPALYLSAGQRRRLSIARLLAAKRPIWLLDEPTAGLDQAARETLQALMGDHLAAEGMIVAATHGPLGLPGARELRLGPAGA